VACRIAAALMGVMISGWPHRARGRARTIVWRHANVFVRDDTARETDDTERGVRRLFRAPRNDPRYAQYQFMLDRLQRVFDTLRQTRSKAPL